MVSKRTPSGPSRRTGRPVKHITPRRTGQGLPSKYAAFAKAYPLSTKMTERAAANNGTGKWLNGQKLTTEVEGNLERFSLKQEIAPLRNNGIPQEGEQAPTNLAEGMGRYRPRRRDTAGSRNKYGGQGRDPTRVQVQGVGGPKPPGESTIAGQVGVSVAWHSQASQMVATIEERQERQQEESRNGEGEERRAPAKLRIPPKLPPPEETGAKVNKYALPVNYYTSSWLLSQISVAKKVKGRSKKRIYGAFAKHHNLSIEDARDKYRLPTSLVDRRGRKSL